VVAHLDVGHAVADRLDDARAFVSENHGEGALGILAREGVCICSGQIVLVSRLIDMYLAIKVPGTWPDGGAARYLCGRRPCNGS
jgi:hypothetical protein